MKRNLNILWGLLLIGGGVLFLLQNLGYLGSVSGYLWALALGVVGLGFLAAFAMDRERWWALIPGTVLVTLGVVAGLTTWNVERFDPWSGPLVLGGVALAFWLVYLARRAFWWALIPAGVLSTLAVVARIDNAGGPPTGSVFFFGLALTFGLVLLATPMRWAIFPAIGLALVGLFILVGQTRFVDFIWPVALIAGGVYLLFRVWRPANR